MVFSSPTFVWLFLPAILAAYFAVPRRARGARNVVLLIASLAFYAFGEHVFVLVMLASILGNYAAGLAIGGATDPRARRAWLTLAVVLDLGLLVAFKYAGWLAHELGQLWALLELDPATGPASWGLDAVHLPIGISFFTFQALSYVMDVYRGTVEPQRRPIDFALYIASFPQLIAGPIVRYKEVAEQLRERRESSSAFAAGARRFAVGLGKKILVANVAGQAADRIFELDPQTLSFTAAWLGTFAYTLQIYFDFSGYSDMAIGLGLLFGFRFPENFAHPYVARSVTDFWRRWHITLSAWFRDYLYVPLGGNRRGRLATLRNLVLVFLLCGLWHGASWSFVVWGLYHGAFLVVERSGFGAWLERLPAALRHAYLLFVVAVGWVFFRAPDLGHALDHLTAMAGLSPAGGSVLAARFLNPHVVTVLACGVFGSLPWVAALSSWAGSAASRGSLGGASLRLAGDFAAGAVLVLAALALSAGTHDPFIYFRF